MITRNILNNQRGDNPPVKRKGNTMNKEQKINRYLSLCRWAWNRYEQGGQVVTWKGFTPSAYTRLERAAFNKYLA